MWLSRTQWSFMHGAVTRIHSIFRNRACSSQRKEVAFAFRFFASFLHRLISLIGTCRASSSSLSELSSSESECISRSPNLVRKVDWPTSLNEASRTHAPTQGKTLVHLFKAGTETGRSRHWQNRSAALALARASSPQHPLQTCTGCPASTRKNQTWDYD